MTYSLLDKAKLPVRKLRREFRFYRAQAALVREYGPRTASAERISFWPGRPSPQFSAICKICAFLGWRTRRSKAGGRTMFWANNEGIFPPQPAGWINGRCTDISKSAVARAFEMAFGYSYRVDPETHTGALVDKSETNAAHDGRVRQGPVVPQPGRVYLRLLDNHHDDSEVEDLRLIVMGGSVLPFLYRKYRPIGDRFSNLNSRVIIAQTRELLTEEEIGQVVAMCSDMGLDYGETDAVRDRGDGRIYVLDVNRTPAGPPNGLPPEQVRRAVEEMAKHFERAFRK